MATLRKIEVLSAGCPTCDETVELVRRIACPACEVSVLDMHEPAVGQRASRRQRAPALEWTRGSGPFKLARPRPLAPCQGSAGGAARHELE